MVVFMLMVSGCGPSQKEDAGKFNKTFSSQYLAMRSEFRNLCAAYDKELVQKIVTGQVVSWNRTFGKTISEQFIPKVDVTIKNIEGTSVIEKNMPLKKKALAACNAYKQLIFSNAKKFSSSKEKPVQSEIFELDEAVFKAAKATNRAEFEYKNLFSEITTGKPLYLMEVTLAKVPLIKEKFAGISTSNAGIAITGVDVYDDRQAYGKNPYFKVRTTEQFILVTFYVANNQKEAFEINTASFKLVDTQGREYSISEEALKAIAANPVYGRGLIHTKINPGMISEAIKLPFEVPASLKKTDLKLFAKGGFIGKDGVSLDLNVWSDRPSLN